MATGSEQSSSARRFLVDYAPLLVAVGVLAVAAGAVALFFLGDRSLARSLLDDYGLAALFCILVMEGAMLLYFAPSESLVPIGITLLAGEGDVVGYATVIVVATLGATVGQYALFLLAKRGGREYLLAKPWFRVSEDALDRFDGWFDRWGRWAVPASNALLFTRGMLTVPAGFAEMDDAEFVALSALGSLVFQTWLALGWLGVLELGIV